MNCQIHPQQPNIPFPILQI
uniref:Uncharacterized protein n=1 Tax=Arundo donax TaxID=35708 RepID=A0A0A8ZE63_ARUDO